MITFEKVLQRRALPQPSPAINEGGDCGACCLAGLFGCFTVSMAYKLSREEGLEPFSWSGMATAIWEARSRDLTEAFVLDIPSWPRAGRPVMQWGNPSWMQTIEWSKYLRMAFEAGYYGLASISHDGDGPFSECDHWVLLCGMRIEEDKRIDYKLLVSCSAHHPDGKWIETREFLQKYGGFNVILVKPV